MKLNKMSCVSILAAVMGLTGMVGVAQAAGHGCKNNTHWDIQEKKCVPNHGCKNKEHWSPKEKKCVPQS